MKTLTLKEVVEQGLWEKVKELRQIAPDATPEKYASRYDYSKDQWKHDLNFFIGFTPEEAEYLGIKN